MLSLSENDNLSSSDDSESENNEENSVSNNNQTCSYTGKFCTSIRIILICLHTY